METQEQQSMLHQLSSIAMTRAAISKKLGMAYGELRDIYKQAGYPNQNTLSYDDFRKEFDRHDIARRVITAYPDATWREGPVVSESADKEQTEFEKDYNKVLNSVNVYHYIRKADVLANIGEFSVVLLGFDDVQSEKDLESEASGAASLIYMQVYSQANAKIKAYYSDLSQSKYGQPEMYELKLRMADNTKATRKILVHESRILHVAEDCIENDYIGTPRLKAVYNRLIDLDKICAASAEGFWRAAWPGLAANKAPECRWTPQSRSTVNTEFQKYAHGFSRTLQLEGVDVKELASQPADPSNHINTEVQLIAGTSKIPKRILMGSESGEMASTQDRENWHDRVMERRMNWAIPYVVDQFLDKLDRSGVLTLPSKELAIDWPHKQRSDRDQTEIDRKRSEMIVKYAKEPASMNVYSHYDFLTKILHHTSEEASVMINRITAPAGEEDE